MLNSNISNPSMSAVKAKVDIYNNGILATTCTCGDVLENFTIDREGDTSKFFGFGICQKLSVNFIDLFRTLTADKLSTGFNIKVNFGDGEIFDKPYPDFYVEEIKRDEKSNTITCTAYDKLYSSAERTFIDLSITSPYTVKQLAEGCAELLGVSLKIIGVDDASFDTLYEDGGNFAPEDTIRYVLNAIAEVTQTIYYLNADNELIFKRLDKDGSCVLTITKDDYFELNTQTARTLAAICSATELGDNVEKRLDIEGVTQYVRDNPLWELREDVAALIDASVEAVGGFTLAQFECDWSGNYLLDIGDKIDLIAEDNSAVTSYLICDSISYAGTLSEITRWEWTEQGTETPSNPSSLGDVLNQTFARVNKQEKQIELYASEIASNAENISLLKLDTQSITASVQSVEQFVNDYKETNDADVETIRKKVDTAVTSEDLTIEISKAMEEGAKKVVTTTGYTFNEDGLLIEKSGKELSTRLTEDGMTIYKNSSEILVVNNAGVNAQDLHATTYLIIGQTSRFEDYNSDKGKRTGCFWIGGL